MGLSQTAVGAKCGVSGQMISLYECDRAWPAYHRMHALAAVFGLRPAYLARRLRDYRRQIGAGA